MNDILHANIFFFITSVAVVAVTLLLIIALWYIIAILREVRVIAQNVRKASDGLEHDLAQLRQEMKSGAAKMFGTVNTLVGYAMGHLMKPPKRHTRRKTETEDGETV